MNVRVSAPGKIHLMGEHAVVYGKPALLSAVNRRTSVIVQESSSFSIHPSRGGRLIREALRVVANRLKLKAELNITLSISSSIPSGRHLGSSAALSVATVGALLYFFKKIWNPQLVNELAYEVEKLQHGNPSGGDNSTSTYGGFIWFRREVEFLKTIWQLPIQSKLLSSFYLIDTGKPVESTGEMVSYVKNGIAKETEKFERELNQNEYATKQVLTSLKTENEEGLIIALKQGEKTLEQIGVVSGKVIPLIRTIEQSGGAAKILGGGGRKGPVGFLLCFHHDQQIIEKISRQFHYPFETVILGEEGVRLESGRKENT